MFHSMLSFFSVLLLPELLIVTKQWLAVVLPLPLAPLQICRFLKQESEAAETKEMLDTLLADHCPKDLF